MDNLRKRLDDVDTAAFARSAASTGQRRTQRLIAIATLAVIAAFVVFLFAWGDLSPRAMWPTILVAAVVGLAMGTVIKRSGS